MKHVPDWALWLGVVLCALLLLTAPKWAKCNELTQMHCVEISFTTYACEDLGLKLTHGKHKWIIGAWGALACGLYRLMEPGKESVKWHKWALDCAGIGVRIAL